MLNSEGELIENEVAAKLREAGQRSREITAHVGRLAIVGNLGGVQERPQDRIVQSVLVSVAQAIEALGRAIEIQTPMSAIPCSCEVPDLVCRRETPTEIRCLQCGRKPLDGSAIVVQFIDPPNKMEVAKGGRG